MNSKKIDGIKARTAFKILADAIKNTEWEGKVFVAGGFVRDDLIGTPSKDIDLVIPESDGGILFASWICNKFDVKTDTNPIIFPRFGTAKFNLRGVHAFHKEGHIVQKIDISDVDFEAVMSRAETYHDGSRKPDVLFGSLRADALRRDFTINSLMKDVSTGRIHDLTGMGLSDLKDNLIRCALDPDLIFREDPLRMLRAIRFTARFHGKLPFSMIKALKRNAEMLQNISQERIQEELCKMLVSDKPSRSIQLLRITGLLEFVLPELTHAIDMIQNHYHKDDVFNHILAVVDGTPNILDARLGALFHDIGKPVSRTVDEDGRVHFHGHEEKGAEITTRAMQRLRFPNETITKISNIVALHMRIKKSGEHGELATTKSLRKLRRDAGEDLETLLVVMDADNKAHAVGHDLPHQIDGIRTRLDELQAEAVRPNLPINGHDILALVPGRRAGPWVKELLSHVEEAWLENPQLTKDDAIGIVQQIILNFR